MRPERVEGAQTPGSGREGRTDDLDVPTFEDLAEALGIGKGLFKSGGEHEHKDPRHIVADADEGVGQTPRQVDDGTLLGRKPLVAAHEVDCSSEDVEGFILVVVDVERRTMAAWDRGLDES
jgi:hypothetical protein